MTNLQIMKKHLKANVLGPLLTQGFTGEYPHFKREKENCIELIAFQTNKYGGSFTVEVSAVFPGKKNQNATLGPGMTLKDLTVWYTNMRYRLKGMYDGWFWYRDLYAKYILGFGRVYLDISEKNDESSVPKGYKLVQKFDETTAQQICREVNTQLEKAFRWLEKFEKKNR